MIVDCIDGDIIVVVVVVVVAAGVDVTFPTVELIFLFFFCGTQPKLKIKNTKLIKLNKKIILL